jgi:PAS domain S-box-containing protein
MPKRTEDRVSYAQQQFRVASSRLRHSLREKESMLKDLTELAETLRRSGDQYRFLAEAIPQIVWTARPDGYNDYFNARWFEYTGLTEEETYTGSKSAVHPDDQERYKRRWMEAVRAGTPYEIEYRFKRASDNSFRWHLGRALPMHDEQGRIIKWFGTCTDIHDQKLAGERVEQMNEELERRVLERTAELEREIAERQNAEQKDRANLQRLRNIIDSMPAGVAIADEKLAVLHVNECYCKYFELDCTPQELVGQPGEKILELLREKVVNADYYGERLKSELAQGLPKIGEEVRLKSGRILSRDYLPIIVDGVSRGHVFLYRDVTQERRLDATKSEFMSLASHQLRTPLTAVRWVLGRLARNFQGKVSDYEARLLQEGRHAVVLMADTIDTMLAISRIEAGKIDLKLTDVEVCAFLRELQEQFRKEYEAKKQSFSLECSANVLLRTDAKFLKEICVNLITNAIKYTPEGGSIKVTVERMKDSLLVSVQDTGYGIPEHQQKRVFSKFFRAENIMDRDMEGTGLGLYLVSLLVRLLGGKITFLSIENQGTTFTLLFPMPTAV